MGSVSVDGAEPPLPPRLQRRTSGGNHELGGGCDLRGRGAAAAQAVDEIGEADLACAAQTLSRQLAGMAERPDLRDPAQTLTRRSRFGTIPR